MDPTRKDSELETRVSQLEASNKAMKRIVFTLIGCALMVCLVAAANKTRSELRAERIVLIDADGNERAVLELEEGEPVLQMHASIGSGEVKLGLWDDRASLTLNGERGLSSAQFAALDSPGQARIILGGGQGGNDKRITLDTSPPGNEAYLRIKDKQGSVTAELPSQVEEK